MILSRSYILSSLPAAHAFHDGDWLLMHYGLSFCNKYCSTVCVLVQLIAWAVWDLLTMNLLYDLSTSYSCLNSISYGPVIVLTTRLPAPTWDNWCDQKLMIDLEWPKINELTTNYSWASDNGPWEKRTTSLQQTSFLLWIKFSMIVVHTQPQRSGRFSQQIKLHAAPNVCLCVCSDQDWTVHDLCWGTEYEPLQIQCITTLQLRLLV